MAGRYTPPKRTAAVLTADIPDDATHHIREGLARRRLVATTGSCPCGATLTLPTHVPAGAVTLLAVEHQDGCPAADPRLDQWTR